MQFFFARSIGFISEMAEATRRHLEPIAARLLLQFDHERLTPLMPVFAAAMRDKGCPLDNCWALLDGTFRHFCRPYIDGYAGAAQQAQFSGHKREHGNNHQGLLTPDGILVEMHGPYEGRTNDQRMLRESGLLDRVLQFCVVLGVLYYLFGDRGYSHGNPALQVPFKGAALTPLQAQFNRKMSPLRVPVEWSFGKVTTNFAFVDFKKNQKLYLQPVESYWRVATLLSNCHSCLYGNQCSAFFLSLPLRSRITFVMAFPRTNTDLTTRGGGVTVRATLDY